MKNILTLFFTICMVHSAKANLIVELSIENQEVQGSDFFFDIYLTRNMDSHGDIYLADLDLVLNFNSQYFTDPVLTAVENDVDATGYCTFSPISVEPQAEVDCRAEYFSKTAVTEIIGNQLTINLLGPEPPDATSFDGLIAWVDGAPNIHRLGRFKISGINDQLGTSGLVWAETQEGTMTKVYSFQSFAPWHGKPVEILTSDPSEIGLDSMVNSTVEKIDQSVSIDLIYPNPVGDELNIKIQSINAFLGTLQIMDMKGHIYFNKEKTITSGANELNINTSRIPPGNYTLSLFYENKIVATNFIKG